MEQYNQRSPGNSHPAVKRLMKEAQELREATEDYFAQPLDDNLFEWHFTVRGPPDSDFDGGVYHGRIILPSEYPMKPPNIIITTPNGRFETNKKICLSISGHHPESWQPSWSLRTAMLALIGFMPTEGQGAIGSLECSAEERKKLARRSATYSCPQCGNTRQLLKEPSSAGPSAANREAKELAAQMIFTSETIKSQEPGIAMVTPTQPVATQTTTSNVIAGGATPELPPRSVEVSSELRQRMQPDQRPSPTIATAVPMVLTSQPPPQTTVTAEPRPAFTIHGVLGLIDVRMVLNVFMIIFAAGFLTLCIRRVCFL
ncbi:ubiquitin-conjugating enzyme E2 J1-like isoform X3 [Varroa jacobsoni]|uniref:ubiquitin-conjugating enzyme E2 J1-like isoform X3 n=1 Tax=Varroa jacobsoni TaxID=62625 RepID=UPI000BF570A2|nr:ubiquitin-conjugating enzyme E2 J1-like isoform X3 [Varroa jacobsoni]